MVRSFTIVAALAVAACQAGPPQNCEIAAKHAIECGEHNNRSDRDAFLRCFPFAKPERIAGAWAYGFETNEFYENQRASVSLVNTAVVDTQLEIAGMNDWAEPQGPAVIVYQMDVIGRRSKCDMGFPRHIIVVDKVIFQG